MAPADDEQRVLTGLQAKDPWALERLYDSCCKRAFGLAYRITSDYALAEDIVQESFLALWQQSERLYATPAGLVPLLLTVIHHKAIDKLRQRRGQTMLFADFPLTSSRLAADETSYLALLAIDRSAVREALASLPAEQRQTIQMAYFAGYTHVEIAAAMNVPLGTVKSRLRIALERLRSLLQGVTNL